jgi:heme/copper-type cytochrome/quinol oxidase subunit 1
MNKISRQIFEELLWLTASLGLKILLASFLFGWSYQKSIIDLHLHDTYYVISSWLIITPLFFFVTFIVFFIKELRKSFGHKLSNWITIISGLTLVILLTILIQTFSQFLIGGWTSYPPLSALGFEDKISGLTQDPIAKFVTIFLTIVQAGVFLMLLFFVYHWGTQKQKHKISGN